MECEWHAKLRGRGENQKSLRSTALINTGICSKRKVMSEKIKQKKLKDMFVSVNPVL